MQYFLEHLAVSFGVASGALAARGKRIDLFGVVVLGLVTAVGGGTLRDLILDVPVFWVSDANYLLTGFIASVLAFYWARSFHLAPSWLQVTDAFFLAFVVMLGTSKTWRLGHEWPVAMVLGVTTGVAGGIIRDVLCGQIPLVFRAHIDLYATAAMIGALVYLGLSHWFPGHPANVVIGAVVIVGLRLAALRWHLRLPELTGNWPADEESSRDQS